MTTSLFLLGLLALLQVVNSRSVLQQDDGPGLTKPNIQSFLENLLQIQQDKPTSNAGKKDIYPAGGDMQGLFDETLEQDYPNGDMQQVPDDSDMQQVPDDGDMQQVSDGSPEDDKRFNEAIEESMKQIEESASEEEFSDLSTAEMQRCPYIFSGQPIALQTSVRIYWMSLWSNRRPHLDYCPGLSFDAVDYSRCVGNVVQLFRHKGRGAVRVGDLVGVYYPRDRLWLGCAGNGLCSKAGCPGHPNQHCGFQDYNRWRNCYGEVFKIFAKGKSNNQLISHKDDVMLMYVRRYEYVSFPGGTIRRSRCPRGHCPPTLDKYDRCWGEVFTIWKQGFTAIV